MENLNDYTDEVIDYDYLVNKNTKDMPELPTKVFNIYLDGIYPEIEIRFDGHAEVLNPTSTINPEYLVIEGLEQAVAETFTENAKNRFEAFVNSYVPLVPIEKDVIFDITEEPVLVDGKYVFASLEVRKVKVVPKSITARQVRLGLLNIEKLDDVENLLNTLEDLELKRKLNIEWEYASEIFRNNEFINTLAPLVGLTEDQIDDLFIAASLIN